MEQLLGYRSPVVSTSFAAAACSEKDGTGMRRTQLAQKSPNFAVV
jgi:hypothetical protein